MKIRNLFVATLIGIALLAGGCASLPPGPAQRQLAAPSDHDLSGVPNFARISDSLWRGGQPTAEGFRNLETSGVKTIINLRHDHDDTPLLAGTHLNYIRIPARPWNPTEDEIVQFLRIVDDPANGPVFVHCAQGSDRTGYCLAAYRIIVDKWTTDDAIREMFGFGYNRIWFKNPAFLRHLDRDLILSQIQRGSETQKAIL
jgi:protein tyrosine/serine phosphatase